MSTYKNVFKQTLIYGLATVLPRVISFLLVGLHTKAMPNTAMYGEVTVLFSYMIFLNVILSYGMETAFFRFFHKENANNIDLAKQNKNEVINTTLVSLFWSSIIFLSVALMFQKTLSIFFNVEKEYVNYAIWILALDALTIIPFAKLRAEQKPIRFAVIKLSNVLVNMFFNFFFLILLPDFTKTNPTGFWSSFYVEEYQIGYVFLSQLIASLITFFVFIPDYIKSTWVLNKELWKQMLKYGWPILFAGLAFGINEHFDKILLDKLLPPTIAKAEVGAYAACYKIGLFMVLYRTAYSLGIEPEFL